jgi:hypothetical protein
MGGTLSRPHEQFPKLFGAPFWREYPYFLPCVATSSFVVLSILVTLCFFKEVSQPFIYRISRALASMLPE